MLMRDLCTLHSLICIHLYPPTHLARFMRGMNGAQVEDLERRIIESKVLS